MKTAEDQFDGAEVETYAYYMKLGAWFLLLLFTANVSVATPLCSSQNDASSSFQEKQSKHCCEDEGDTTGDVDHSKGCCDRHGPSSCHYSCCGSYIGVIGFSVTPPWLLKITYESEPLSFANQLVAPPKRPPIV